MDHRANLTLEELNLIKPREDRFLIEPFCFSLIDSNLKFRVYDKYDYGLEDLRFIETLTDGQKIMSFLRVLDGQILNGGIEQFLFNYPHYIEGVRWSLDKLEADGNAKVFDRVVETLALKQTDFDEIKKHIFRGEIPDLEDFSEIYEVLDLGWFDGEWTHDYLMRLINYVRKNPFEFITGVKKG